MIWVIKEKFGKYLVDARLYSNCQPPTINALHKGELLYWSEDQKKAEKFESFAAACLVYVTSRLQDSRIVKLKPRPKCPTCGRAR